MPAHDMRIGQGFDAHRLVEGRPLVLLGVTVPFDKGLEGHSDADVAAHAVMDALLGALALGDIGTHFPPGVPAWKDAFSMELMDKVTAMAGAKGYRVSQVDVTIMAEAPRLAPHVEAMRKNLAERLGLKIECASVKATTTEGMGFIGRGEGIAALALAVLVKKQMRKAGVKK